MPHLRPLFTSQGSVYHRRPYRESSDEDEDEAHVEASLPSTPTDMAGAWSSDWNGPEAGPSRSRAWEYAVGGMSGRESEEPSRGVEPARVKLEDIDPRYDGDSDAGHEDDDEDELREVTAEDGDYEGIGVDPVEDPHEEPEPDDRQCRICFAGAEEEDALGRLISPCLCSGSMRYVHVSCINAWRGTGSNAKAFMECPQCHHRYQLRRTLVSGLATSRPILLLLSSVLFVSLTLLTGHILHQLLLRPSTKRAILKPRTISTLSAYGSDWDDDWDDDGFVIVGGGGALIYDVVLGAIQTFATVANRFSSSRDRVIAALPPILGMVIFALGVRFILGIAVLGSLSFLSLLLSLSLFAPLQLANGFRGAGLFNFGRRRGARAAADGTAIGQIMIVIFVLIGAANTLVQVYSGVETLTQRLLRYVETQILEVNPEERTRASRRRAHEQWWNRWWREKRWRTRRGWEEIGLRLRLAAQHGLGPMWEKMFGHRDDPLVPEQEAAH